MVKSITISFCKERHRRHFDVFTTTWTWGEMKSVLKIDFNTENKIVQEMLNRFRGRLHGQITAWAEFQPGWPSRKNAIKLEISAQAETECESENRCFLYLLFYTVFLRMRLWIYSPSWKCLAIAWRHFQPGLKFAT